MVGAGNWLSGRGTGAKSGPTSQHRELYHVFLLASISPSNTGYYHNRRPPEKDIPPIKFIVDKLIPCGSQYSCITPKIRKIVDGAGPMPCGVDWRAVPGASSGGSWSTRRGGMGNSWSRWTASFHPVSYAPLAALNGPAQRICPCESGFAPSAALSMTGM